MRQAPPGRLLLGATVLLGVACAQPTDSNGSDSFGLPAWHGTYSYRAENARKCTEGEPTYTCTCAPPGFYEGTLTLAGTRESPSGQLAVRECHPGQPCGDTIAMPLVSFFAHGPNDSFGFCVGHCSVAGRANDGGWEHWVNSVKPDSVSGSYRHADGSPRGCGMDFDYFTAVRK